jgi:hypothetical protein
MIVSPESTTQSMTVAFRFASGARASLWGGGDSLNLQVWFNDTLRQHGSSQRTFLLLLFQTHL